MNIDPTLYNKSNFLQKRDAIRLIQRVAKDYIDQPQINQIVDVGCGTGNVTHLLSEEVKSKQITGMDISPLMIKFAENNYSSSSVHFVTADILFDFDQLESQLGVAEGTADIVISVYCLHWVKDKRKAMVNISRLLRQGGCCYILLFSWSDLLPVQQQVTRSAKWKPFFESLLHQEESPPLNNGTGAPPFAVEEPPNEQKELQFWQELCNDCGLQVKDALLTHTFYTYSTVNQFQSELQALCHFLPFVPREKHQEFLVDYFDCVNSQYVAKQQSGKPNAADSSVKLYYDYITVVASKT